MDLRFRLRAHSRRRSSEPRLAPDLAAWATLPRLHRGAACALAGVIREILGRRTRGGEPPAPAGRVAAVAARPRREPRHRSP